MKRVDPSYLKQSADPGVLGVTNKLLVSMLDAAGNGKRNPVRRNFSNIPHALALKLLSLSPLEKKIIDNRWGGLRDIEICEGGIEFNKDICLMKNNEIAFFTSYLYDIRNKIKLGYGEYY